MEAKTFCQRTQPEHVDRAFVYREGIRKSFSQGFLEAKFLYDTIMQVPLTETES